VAASVPASAPVVETDYQQFASAADFHAYLQALSASQPLAVWLNLEAGEREAEGFGTRVASIEVSSKAGEGRSAGSTPKGEV